MQYATRAQLAMEERMLAQARADGAPRLTRAAVAAAWCAGSVTTACLVQDRGRAMTWPSHRTVTASGDAITSTSQPMNRGSTE